MEPPPFEHPMIRKCIKTNVRIQSQEALQEVLILTTVLCSVDDQLNRSTSIRSISSRSQDGAYDLSSSDEDIYSETSEESSEDENRAAPQSRDEQRYKMKAFWLRKDPIAEVNISA